MIAVAQHALSVWWNDLGQGRLAVLECRAAQIPTIAIEQVESEEGQRRRFAVRDSILEASEARCAIGLQTDQLTIDQRSIDRQFPEPLCEFREISLSNRGRRE